MGVAATRIVRGNAYVPCRISEGELRQSPLSQVQAGDIMVGDRNFATAAFPAQVLATDAGALMRKHAPLQVTHSVG